MILGYSWIKWALNNTSAAKKQIVHSNKSLFYPKGVSRRSSTRLMLSLHLKQQIRNDIMPMAPGAWRWLIKKGKSIEQYLTNTFTLVFQIPLHCSVSKYNNIEASSQYIRQQCSQSIPYWAKSKSLTNKTLVWTLAKSARNHAKAKSDRKTRYKYYFTPN